MRKSSTITPAVVVATSVSLLGGGFAGAIFTWYSHRPSPATVTYAITQTSTGADSVTKGLIPNLKIKIGNDDVPVVYTDIVELSAVRGDYVDSAEVAITFPSELHIYGFRGTAPSNVHNIACNQVRDGLVCKLSPLSPGTKYVVNVAADRREPPTVVTASRNTELVPLDAFVASESRSWRARLLSRDAVLTTIGSFVYASMFGYFLAKRLRLLSFIGRVTDINGNPVAGAAVKVRVDKPPRHAHTYSVVKTDSEGDFIVRSGSKKRGLEGTVTVESEGFSTLESRFTNPILFLKLIPKDWQFRDTGESARSSSRFLSGGE
jgi:hypothetical protein